VVWCTGVSAQGLTANAARPEDVRTLDGIIAAFYDVISHGAGEPIDWARDSTLYLADLRFKIVDGSPAAARVNIADHAAFAASQSDVSEGFVEREIHRVTQRFGPIAQVFSTYEWRRSPDGPVGGRGINSIELFFDGTRWWISSAMWTSETPDNPIPQQYLRRE
jgi:hypothetical protein